MPDYSVRHKENQNLYDGRSFNDQLEKLGVTLITGDVTNKESMLAGMKNCHRVVNLANVYSFWERNK